MYCLKCGTRNPATATSCSRCGQKLQRKIKVEHKAQKKKMRLNLAKPIAAEVQASPQRADFEVNKVYCGDCLDVMGKMPGEFVDLIITSPPYNFGLDEYDTHKDTKSWAEYFDTLYEAFSHCYRVLKEGGRMCVVIQPLFSDYIATHHIVSEQLRDLGFLFKAEIMWEKHNYNCKYTAWGSWKSPSAPYLKYSWEFIEVFCKGSQKRRKTRELGQRYGAAAV